MICVTGFITFFAVLILFTACRSIETQLIQSLESAHGASSWQQYEYLEASITVIMPGHEDRPVILWMTTDLSCAWVDAGPDLQYIFQDDRIEIRRSDKGAVQHDLGIKWWPALIGLPFLQEDSSLEQKDLQLMLSGGSPFPVLQVRKRENNGAGIYGHHLVYLDPRPLRQDLIHAVVPGLDVMPQDPDRDSRAVGEYMAFIFEDYQKFQGGLLSTRWRCGSWTSRQGLLECERFEIQFRECRFFGEHEGPFPAPGPVPAGMTVFNLPRK
jgi:hypothetical protein